MKKIFKSILAMAAAIGGLASCTSGINPENCSDSNIFVRATTEAGTKASLSGDDETGYEVHWQTGDEISIDGRTFILQSGEGTCDGVFQLESGQALSPGTFDAYYPSAYNGSGWLNEQDYVAGNITGSPMKAQAVVSGDGRSISDLHFKNEGGILRITVKGSQDLKVKSVSVTADELSNAITLTCASPVALNEESGVQFHIAMPENKTGYSNLCVVFKDGDNNAIETKTLKQGTLVIKRSNITKASFEIRRTASLRVATYNVDGLPVFLPLGDGWLGKFVKSLDQTAASIDDNYNLYINKEGPGADGSAIIGAKIAGKGWDVFGLNEDFNYHYDMCPYLKDYSWGTYKGGFNVDEDKIFSLFIKFLARSPLFNIDGLELGVKTSCCKMSSETMVQWNPDALYGYLTNYSDELTKKGFRHYQVEVNKSGIKANVDFIILHAEAGDEPEDIKARENGYAQLVEFIKGVDTGNPMIMMGDWNSRYYLDNFEKLFIGSLNAIEGVHVKDAWVEYCNGGNYPQYGGPAGVQPDKSKAEELDKILFLNRDSAPIELELISAGTVTDFVNGNGNQLSDHYPVEAEFKIVCK